MYNITEEKVIVENEEHIVYGIKCDEACMPNVSANSGEVEQFIERLNKYELSPCHLYDAVEDYLNTAVTEF